MATTETAGDGGLGLLPGEKANKRASYFEMLSSISSELDFMLKDLKKNENFTPTSPRSPLNAANSKVSFETKDRTLLRNSLHLESGQRLTEEGLILQLPPKTSSKSNPPSSPLSTIPASPSPSTQDPPKQPPPAFPTGPIPAYASDAPTTPDEPSPAMLASLMAEFGPSLEDNSLTVMTRLVHTRSIWFLPSTQRAAAAHYLQGQPVGTFVIRQARQRDKLSLTLKHPGTGKGPYIESYPIDSDPKGVKLSNEDMVFPVVDDLVAYHIQNQGVIPCRLALPVAVMAARNLREIQSLAVLEEDFWKSSHSKSPAPHSSKPDPFIPDAPNESRNLFDPLSATKPQLLHSFSEGANSRTKDIYQCPSNPVGNRTAKDRTHSGVYGVLSSPPVIYENTPTKDDVFARRPNSWDSVTRFSFLDEGSRTSAVAPVFQPQRPPSQLDRQDMRFSSASEFDFVTSTTEQRYPPPKCAPPPPPSGGEGLDMFLMPSMPWEQGWPGGNPTRSSAVEYSLPYDQPPLPAKTMTFSTYGKPLPTQRPVVPSGYGVPVPGGRIQDIYQAPQAAQLAQSAQPAQTAQTAQPAIGTIGNCLQQQQQQQQQWMPRTPVNYSAPPLPARLPASWAGESLQLATPRSTLQTQNILQPTSVASAAVSDEPGAWTPLPDFDPLFSSEDRHPAREGTLAAAQKPSSPTAMRDLMLTDLQYGMQKVSVSETYSSPSINNNTAPNKMAPRSNVSDRTTSEVKTSQLISINDDEQCVLEPGKVYWDYEMDQNPDVEDPHILSMENSSESEDELMSPTAMESIGIPHTENQNGNHLVLSHSTDEGELEQSREGEKKDYKRNKQSKISKIKGLAKKGSKEASKKLQRISKKSKPKREPTVEIQESILRAANNANIGLGALVHSFIRTQDEKCMTDKPDVVLRSIRQCMSGIKNYLLNRREPEVDAVIDRYFPQYLNDAELGAIIEGALHQCVLEPLNSGIGISWFKEYKENGSMELMDHNMTLAKSKTPEELGIKPNYIPPEGEDLEDIRRLFSQLQGAYSPVKKLELLLKIVSAIYNSVRDKNTGREVTHSMGADDFLPMLIHVLVQCDMMTIEIEADYMWGLLDPSMLSGEGGYYLTTLSSAILVLKQFEEETERETKGFITVLAATCPPDPICFILKTLPVLPGMMANNVCRILANGMDVDDSQADNYRLYLLQDSGETLIEDSECPLQIKNEQEASGVRGCRFGFRSIHAQVFWPQTSGIM